MIAARGTQQYRTVWASAEILAATFVVNAVTLGSFLRDKGAKKNKYKRSYSVTESADRASARRPTLATLYQFDDSDDDDDDAALFHSMGYGIPAHLRTRKSPTPRPAPPAFSAREGLGIVRETHEEYELDTREAGGSSESDDSFRAHKLTSPLPGDVPTTHGPSFFGIGHPLEDSEHGRGRRPPRATTMDSGGAVISAQDFAASIRADSGSCAFLRDVGGMLNTMSVSELRNGASSRRWHHDVQDDSRLRSDTAPVGVVGPLLERHETQVSLQDAGGLLNPESHLPHTDAGSQPNVHEPMRHLSAAELFGMRREHDTQGNYDEIALQQMQNHHSSFDELAAVTATPQVGGPDDMVIHDLGGLTER